MNAPTPAPALELRGLCKSFGGLQVTDGVDLALQPGARHALIGPNGAGKSTLVGLISGAIAPDAGQVRLFGRDITRSSPQARVKAGLVRSFQITSLFPRLTALENVLLALHERSGKARRFWAPLRRGARDTGEAREILSGLRIADQADTAVENLSYGQQRLVELALVLALRPRVLLLDEPAAGVPSTEGALLMRALEKLPADMAILMIEHDMKLVREFSREVTVLVAGRVLASGGSREVMNSKLVRDVYLGKSGHERFLAQAHA